MNVLQFRWSPVHLAAYYGQLQAVTVLLQRYNCQPDQKERVRSMHNVYLHVNVKWWKCINQLKWDFGNIPSLNVSVQWSATLSELGYMIGSMVSLWVYLHTYYSVCTARLDPTLCRCMERAQRCCEIPAGWAALQCGSERCCKFSSMEQDMFHKW